MSRLLQHTTVLAIPSKEPNIKHDREISGHSTMAAYFPKIQDGVLLEDMYDYKHLQACTEHTETIQN